MPFWFLSVLYLHFWWQASDYNANEDILQTWSHVTDWEWIISHWFLTHHCDSVSVSWLHLLQILLPVNRILYCSFVSCLITLKWFPIEYEFPSLFCHRAHHSVMFTFTNKGYVCLVVGQWKRYLRNLSLILVNVGCSCYSPLLVEIPWNLKFNVADVVTQGKIELKRMKGGCPRPRSVR